MLKRSIPVGVPRSYRELVQQLHFVLTERAAELGLSLKQVVSRLQERKLLEGFCIDAVFPKTFTWDEAVAYLGLSNDQWHRLLKRTKQGGQYAEIRPYVCSGADGAGPAEPWDMTASYWGLDILRISDFLDAKGVERKSCRCEALEESFFARFKSVLAKVDPTDVAVVVPHFDEVSTWPKDLPKNPEELVTMYRTYVFDQVRRLSRIKTEEELKEVTQHVWLYLLQSKVLEKFVDAALTKLPRTLTLDDVLGYLGITLSQWTNAVRHNKRDPGFWMPLPVKGTVLAEDSLYLTEDIQTLDSSGFLEGRRNEPRRHPDFTGRGFRSYLAMAVRNHFMNMHRTRSRRHQERCVESQVVLTSDTSGMFHRSYTSDENACWEENLSNSGEIDMEDMLDMAAQLRRNGVDPQTEEGREVLDHMTRGLTIKEAVKCQQRQQVRAYA